MAHFMIGIILAVIYLAVIYAVVSGALPGPPMVYGAIVGGVYGEARSPQEVPAV